VVRTIRGPVHDPNDEEVQLVLLLIYVLIHVHEDDETQTMITCVTSTIIARTFLIQAKEIPMVIKDEMLVRKKWSSMSVSQEKQDPVVEMKDEFVLLDIRSVYEETGRVPAMQK
jgi:hypothetical protein